MVLIRMLTPRAEATEAELLSWETARSIVPSLLKSAATTPVGVTPTATVTGAAKDSVPPLEVFIRMVTVLLPLLAVMMSSRPSPFRSARVTLTGVVPAGPTLMGLLRVQRKPAVAVAVAEEDRNVVGRLVSDDDVGDTVAVDVADGHGGGGVARGELRGRLDERAVALAATTTVKLGAFVLAVTTSRLPSPSTSPVDRATGP